MIVRRVVKVASFWTLDEVSALDRRRGRMSRAAYLRAAALHRPPPTVPEVNREQWAELARTAANLNQIAHRLNAGDALPLAEVRAALEAFRRSLIGVAVA